MREADLARMCLASGLNALSRANHMNKGLYTQAFFNVSVGLERLMKLIYLIDHAVQHTATFPSKKDLQGHGHDLINLFTSTTAIRDRLVREGEYFEWGIPDPALADVIITVLAEFATKTRYYNLDYLVGAKKLGRDPIETWALEVGGYLLGRYPDRLRKRDQQSAASLEESLQGHIILRQDSISGSDIRTPTEAVLEGRRNEWIQRYATFHCATIIRDLMQILWALDNRARGIKGLELPELHEFFREYYNSNDHLMGRRTFLK